MTPPRRILGYERLRALPPVFSLHDLRLGPPQGSRGAGAPGLTNGAERVALARWTARDMVRPAGPRLGRYYNLVADPRGPDVHLGTVLTAEFGSVVLIGATVLADSHWTTQIPHLLTVAVPMARSIPQIEGALIYGRPPEWFSAVRSSVRAGDRGRFALPSLTPEFALADALRHGDSLHGLAPDDIEVPDPDERAEDLMNALSALHVPPDRYAPYLEASGIEVMKGLGPGPGR